MGNSILGFNRIIVFSKFPFYLSWRMYGFLYCWNSWILELYISVVESGGGGKQKTGQDDGRNRRVLRDIGNFVPAQAVERKPQNQVTRPMTRLHTHTHTHRRRHTDSVFFALLRRRNTIIIDYDVIAGVLVHSCWQMHKQQQRKTSAR